MNRFNRILPVTGTGILLFLILSSCTFFNETTSEELSVFTGTVIHESTGDPVEGALIRITEPQSLAQTTVTNAEGNFTIQGLLIDGSYTISIEITKENYHTSYSQHNASAGSDIEAGTIHLHLETEEDSSGNDEGNGNGEDESGGAASLILTNITNESIQIQETGGNIYTAITFVVQDSTGRSLTSGQSVMVDFDIFEGPGDGEALTPASVETDGQGVVTVNLISGYSAGVVRLRATIDRQEEAGITITSSPVAVTIHGGFPHINHFSLGASINNFEGWNVIDNRNEIKVLVGDKFSNPVKEGTAVYFSTTGGVIQGSGTGHTNSDGIATVELISGDPNPNDPILGIGYAIVTATTIGEDTLGDETQIHKEIPVLFSGAPTHDHISISPDNTFTVPAGGSQTYTLTVTDLNENPLPYNTSITVEMGNEILTLSGQTDITVPNALFTGGGVTVFSFTVQDNDDENLDPQSYDITVNVNTPMGYSAQRTFSD